MGVFISLGAPWDPTLRLILLTRPLSSGRSLLTVKRPTYTLCDFEQGTFSEPQFFPR